MSAGIMGLVEVCVLGQRVTVVTKETRVLSNGVKKKIHVSKNYWIENGKAKEELTYFTGNTKKRLYGKPVSIRSLFRDIKHVYDKNGVLIARRNHPKDHLRCTAKGMGRSIQETNKRITKTEHQKVQTG
jgi:hypothetical protein